MNAPIPPAAFEPTDLAALRALLTAVPAAPWRVAESQPAWGIRTEAGWEVVYASYADSGPQVLELIAAMRNQVPALLDEVERTRAELAHAREYPARVQRRILTWNDDPLTRLEAFAITWEQVEAAERGRDAARADADQMRSLARDADEWIERVGMSIEAIIIMAEDKTPGLALLADLARWNDHRRALLADATPAAVPQLGKPGHCGLCGSEDCPGRPGEGCMPGPFEPVTVAGQPGSSAGAEHGPDCAGREGDVYYCPTSGDVESPCHGGFDVCCAAPELHRAAADTDQQDAATCGRCGHPLPYHGPFSCGGDSPNGGDCDCKRELFVAPVTAAAGTTGGER